MIALCEPNKLSCLGSHKADPKKAKARLAFGTMPEQEKARRANNRACCDLDDGSTPGPVGSKSRRSGSRSGVLAHWDSRRFIPKKRGRDAPGESGEDSEGSE